MKIKSWLFDVDGTLTPSRKPMTPAFREWFLKFAKHNEVHLVTGSDYPKTLEQVGPEILREVATVFNCMGNSVWRNGVEIRHQAFDLPEAAEAFLNGWLEASDYPHRCGQHIERRPGLVNFSVVGRGAETEKRDHYFQWDKQSNERVLLALAFEAQFPGIACQIAGETGVDIFPVGRDKSQVLNDQQVSGPAGFFGDRIQPGGNDYSLAMAVEACGGLAHPVTSWEQTWETLQQYESIGWLHMPR